MAVLGDSPEFLMNTIGSALTQLFGGADLLGPILLIILAYLALVVRLDRGGLVLLGTLGIGIMISFGTAIPESAWWIIIVVGVFMLAYGILNAMRQGEG